MQKSDPAQQNLDLSTTDDTAVASGPVECLGMTFPNDEARREHFLGILREGLEELHARLGGVPFTTVEDAVERMKSVETDLQDSKSGRAEGALQMADGR